MMAHPESERPFVILEHRVTKRFVQYAGSLTRPLVFDVPELDKTVTIGSAQDPSIYAEAVRLGFETLSALVFDRTHPADQERALGTSDLTLVESIGSGGDGPARTKPS
jgi:hypothetical protein